MFYTYVDWTCEDVARPFYVGKGLKYRVEQLERNELHKRITQKYGMQREVVFQNVDEQLTLDKEVELIRVYNTYVGEGWGANLTRGGDGCSGYRHTSEACDKVAYANSQRIWSQKSRDKLSSTLTGRKHTDIQKTLIGETHLGLKHTDEARQRMSDTRKMVIGKFTQEGTLVATFLTVKLAALSVNGYGSNLTKHIRNETLYKMYYWTMLCEKSKREQSFQHYEPRST